MNCSELLKGLVGAECNKSATAGVESKALLINFSDVDKAKSVVEDNVIKTLVMKSGKKAYEFSTYETSYNEGGATFVKGTYRNTWQHTLPLRVFTKNKDSKDFANNLAAGAKIIVIMNNKEAGAAGEVKYEAYGWDNGMELSEGASTLAMADGLVYDLKVSSTDTAQEGSLPKSIFDTDLETTETKIASLTA